MGKTSAASEVYALKLFSGDTAKARILSAKLRIQEWVKNRFQQQYSFTQILTSSEAPIRAILNAMLGS